MFRICGCDIAPTDIRRLLDLLDDDNALDSAEAAAAIRWSHGASAGIDEPEPEIRNAIARVLGDKPLPPTLTCLRDALEEGCC